MGTNRHKLSSLSGSSFLRVVAYFASFACCSITIHGAAYGHGTPINVFLDPASQQLYVLPNFTSGPLLPFGGPVYSLDPGIGVSNPGNGIPDGATIGLNVLEPLWFADSSGIVEPPEGAEILLSAPTVDSFGHAHSSPVPSYSITAETGYQTGLTWGVYDGSVPGWDSHGRYDLVDPSVPAGIYAQVVQVTSPGYVPSEPILIPMEYDPFATFELPDAEAAIAALRAQVEPLSAADFDADGDVDGNDFLSWQTGFGMNEGAIRLDGDSDADGDVDGNDFLAWQSAFEGSVGNSAGGAGDPVPEPTSMVLVGLMLVVGAILTWHRRNPVGPVCRMGPLS